jgi:hypothetical protein
LFREDNCDAFDDLVDAIAPDAGCFAVLRAYFDASKRPSGVFTIAGYLFDSYQARKFRRDWDQVFGPYGGLHMTNLAALQGAYRDRVTRPQSHDMCRAAVEMIRERMTCGVVVSCWVQDIHTHSPRWIRGFGHPYAVCCHLAMATMGTWARENNYRTGIAYLFENGDEYASEASVIMQNAASHPIVQEQYQYRSHGFVGKQDALACPIQAADFLAWEWGKFFDETAVVRKRPMRKSLAYLLNGQMDRYMLRPMFGERFARYLSQINDLGLEELQERAQGPEPTPVQIDVGGSTP